MFLNNPNGLVVYGLVLVLGVLIGLFLTAGGRKKWKTRYYDEIERRKVIERDHATAEADWREREKTHEAALRDIERDRARAAVPVAAAAPVVAARDPRDVNDDGVVTPAERKPGIMDRMLGRDRDGDGIPDRKEGYVDRDGDGVDDRVDRRPDDDTRA
jgi:hypothetical protein